MEYFAVYAVDNTSFIVLRDLLVNEEVGGAMEAFGLGIGNRDIYESERHASLSCGNVGSDESDRFHLRFFMTSALSFRPHISQLRSKCEALNLFDA